MKVVLNGLARSVWLMLWGLICLGSLPLHAIDSAELDALSAEFEAVVSRVEEADLDESFKVPLRERLDEASKRLGGARADLEQAIELEAATPGLPKLIEQKQQKLESLPDSSSIDAEGSSSLIDLHGQLDVARAEVAKWQSELSSKERELMELRAAPVEIGTRLPEANGALSKAEAKVAALDDVEDPSLEQEVDRLDLRVGRAALSAEVDLLEAKRVGYPLREQLAVVEAEFLEQRLAAEQEKFARLDAAVREEIGGEIDRLRDQVEQFTASVPSSRPQLASVAGEMAVLVGELQGTADQLESVSRKIQEARDQLEDLRMDNDRLRRQTGLSGLEGAFTQVLMEQRQRMPDRRGLDYELKLRQRELSSAQLAGLRIEELRREQRQLEILWKGDATAAPILQVRAKLLDRLDVSQSALVRRLAELAADEQAYRDLVVDFTEFLSDQLFWRRSSDPVGPRFFAAMPRAFVAIFNPAPWSDLIRAIREVPRRHPGGTAAVVVFGVAMVLLRRRFRQSIEKSGMRIRRISTDRLVHTLRALLESLLLVLPIPMLLAFLSWALASDSDPDPLVRGFGLWLGWSAKSLMWVFALCELAREGGVGQVHLGWSEGASKVLRLWLPRVARLYLPAVFIAMITLFDGDSHAFESLGRLSFILAQIVLAWAMVGVFRPDTGVFSELVKERPNRLLVRSRFLWMALLIGVSVALCVMALAGFVLTAFMLSEQFLSVLRWFALGVLIYGVGLRWFMIKQRRIALAEAIQERQARREAADHSVEDGEEAVIVDDDRIELALDDVVSQTRRLLRSLVGVGVLVLIAYNLARELPIDQAADFKIFGRLAWIGVAKGLLIGMVALTVIRNLPGLLDLLGLRESGVEPGTRYAVATLCQYALGAIGLLLVAEALELEWSRFGWIAAALSVGLGFGLQEIVANFVCGIILLFERPMRVGDVVTVGEVTGTVSRIRMRATTITNWERQEFVVPNKDFITGSLINWTLSSPLNRVTIEVGVAYGTDTAEARRILAEIADDHPVVLEDPAPLVNFEAFADSTLNLSVRCYLPNMDNRMRTVTELHEEIDRRFKEAGIEIAFPQQDLHIRTVPNELIRAQSAVEKDN